MKKNLFKLTMLTICVGFALSICACNKKQANNESNQPAAETQASDENDSSKEQSQPPVSADQMKTIIEHVFDMDDNPAAATAYIDEQMKAAGLERIPSSYESTNMKFYGRNASIKEIDTGYLFDLKDDESFVVQVNVIEEYSMQVAFKKKEWINDYRSGIKKLDYVKVPFLDNPGEEYAEVGGINYFFVDENADEDFSTVLFAACYWEEPPAVTADDAAGMMEKQYPEAKEMAETRNYQLALEDLDDDGDGDVYLTEGCELQSKGGELGYEVVGTGEEYESFSALKLVLKGNVVKELILEMYGLNTDSYVEDLVHGSFQLTKSTDKSRMFKHKNGSVATVTIIDGSHSVLKISK